MNLAECYAVLDVGKDSDKNQIRQSYRKLAKKFHPDKNPKNVKWAEREFRRIVEAYQTIVNTLDGDDGLERVYEESQIGYWEQIRQQGDSASLARLMLHEFLSDNFPEAVRIYERLKTMDAGFRLDKHLEREDCIDCEFMLGEEYEQQGDYEKAFFFFERVFESELQSPRMFGYFLEETTGRVYNICYRKLHKEMGESDAEQFYRRALKFQLNEKERANIFMRLYEVYKKTKRDKEANQAIGMAWNLNPEMRRKRTALRSS